MLTMKWEKNLFFIQVSDVERLPLAVKELGTCDLYPQVSYACSYLPLN